MSSLIEGAKQKIWSIANSIIAQKPTPDIRIGLISYRDRGDDYVTRIFDLTDDIDTVSKNLSSFSAGGGGDSPESVNQALHEGVTKISWSNGKNVLKIVFLVGDCPPHTDYQDDVKYQVSCQEAARKNIIINTVQCGSDGSTTAIWQEIARLSEGAYVALAQTGGMHMVATPFDSDIAKISGAISSTVVGYGKEKEQAEVRKKIAAAAEAPAATAASRAVFNVRTGGRAIQGRNDLLSDIADGTIRMEEVKDSELSPEMQKMDAGERKAYVSKQQEKRNELNKQLSELGRKRAEFVDNENRRLAAEGKGDAFDLKVAEIISVEAKKIK